MQRVSQREKSPRNKFHDKKWAYYKLHEQNQFHEEKKY